MRTYHSAAAPRRFAGLVFLAALALSVLILPGCSGKSQVNGGSAISGGTGQAKRGAAGTKPYTIKGQTYVPMLNAHGYSEEGMASWYGKDFHGKKTANGEIYDMHGMTAAHKLLPFGTQLKVTNLDNNRAIVVRVNDRGPFVANRVIDLTHSGAAELDMIGPGTARVRLESIGTVPGQRGNDLIGQFYVQVGSFEVKENAHALAKKLQARGKAARVVYVPEIHYHRVQAGPYGSLAAAEAQANSLQGEFPGNFVVAQ